MTEFSLNGTVPLKPDGLFLPAHTDAPRVQELRAEIRKHYIEKTMSKDKDDQMDKRHECDTDGPDHGMQR
jgi:hypothetical protein